MMDAVVPRRLHSSSMPRCFSAISSPRRIKGLTGRRFTGAALYAKGRKGAVGTRLTKNVGRGPPYNPSIPRGAAVLPIHRIPSHATRSRADSPFAHADRPRCGLDNVSRVIAERLSTQLGQPMTLDNRGGAACTQKRRPHFTGL